MAFMITNIVFHNVPFLGRFSSFPPGIHLADLFTVKLEEIHQTGPETADHQHLFSPTNVQHPGQSPLARAVITTTTALIQRAETDAIDKLTVKLRHRGSR